MNIREFAVLEMESVGVFPDGEWDSFSSIFDSDEVNSLPRYLGNFPLLENYDAGLNSAPQTCFDPPDSIGVHGANKSWCHSLDALTADFNLSKHDYRHSSYDTFQPSDISIFIDMNSMGVKKTCSFPPSLTENLEEDHHRALCLGGHIGSHGYENLDYNLPTSTDIKSSDEEEKLKRKLNGRAQNIQLAYNAKKKNRVSQHVQKSVKTVESPKSTYKSVKNSSKTSAQEDGNGGSEGQSSSSNSTDDENASRDTNGDATSASKRGEVLKSNEKTRAARGSATDPQSIYARKRRERINERLRILQKLVPNGTKVDISTMLEEAVHYVKFLQLQIKLLSSDDHWMYAPIAYNGMDIGLHQKISPLQLN